MLRAKKATGDAEILFNNLRNGYPSFDLERKIIRAEMQSEDVTDLIVEEQDPDKASKHLCLEKRDGKRNEKSPFH